MKKFWFGGVLSLCAFTAVAQENGYYAERGFTAVHSALMDGASYSPSVMRGILGKKINSNFSIEGFLGFGLASGNFDAQGALTSLKVDNAYGVYIKPNYQLNADINVYTRIGISRFNSTLTSSAGLPEVESIDGPSYGAGVSYKLDPRFSVNMDIMSYGGRGKAYVDGLTVGVGFKF
jgi:opacity protein-like surface antigen